MKIKRKNGMPIWAAWIARDNNGDVFIYEYKPIWMSDRGYFDHEGKGLGGRAANIKWPVAAPSVGQCFAIAD